MSWHVYILRCSNGSYYVGHTCDVAARLAMHQAGEGGRHTATYRPVTLVYEEEALDHAAALNRERQLKGWSRAKKEALMRGDLVRLKRLAQCRSLYPLSSDAE